MSLRVLIIDDHTMVREAIAGVIDAHPGLTVVAQAASLAEARRALHEVAINVAVVDVTLPDGDGLSLVRSMREASKQVGIVVLTMHDDERTLVRAREAGASALVLKSQNGSDVVAAIIASARRPEGFMAEPRPESAGGEHEIRLTPREQDVLARLADGESIAEVASHLFMSESTVKTHTARLYDKLGAHNRAGAVMAAVRLGLVDPA